MMQVVIPMSGVGQRFLDAGYKVPKPLISVEGREMIAYVLDCFPGETNLVFICNEEHLKTTDMRSVLEDLAPQALIVSVAPHKLGPVYAVSKAFDAISDTQEVIVSYCDFAKLWDYHEFLRQIRTLGSDGAISGYRGFHPHMLGTTNYAFCRECDGDLIEIREKQPFTDQRMQEFASDGTYYFKTGAILKHYFLQLMEKGIQTAGEYYVSMVFNLMVEDGLKVSLFEIEHMLQWGTPEDLNEYLYYSKMFQRLAVSRFSKEIYPHTLIMPMAGSGSRFSQRFYNLPKPLIPVSQKPMVAQAVYSLPQCEDQVFIVRDELLEKQNFGDYLNLNWPKSRVLSLSQTTEGQASTCALGVELCDVDKPILIGACDTALIWDSLGFQELIQRPDLDCVVFSFKNHPQANKNPKAYGWLQADENRRVKKVSVKNPLNLNPENDLLMVGSFWFKNPKVFQEGYRILLEKQLRVNNEFYVDSLIEVLLEQGFCVVAFEVFEYLCFGTPDELNSFLYWQKFFSKVEWHPYEMFHNCPLL